MTSERGAFTIGRARLFRSWSKHALFWSTVTADDNQEWSGHSPTNSVFRSWSKHPLFWSTLTAGDNQEWSGHSPTNSGSRIYRGDNMRGTQKFASLFLYPRKSTKEHILIPENRHFATFFPIVSLVENVLLVWSKMCCSYQKCVDMLYLGLA